MTIITYRTKRDVAADLLREEIIGGTFAPGTRLMLEELSQRYNISMTPIREAFSLLESEGLISQLPHKGAIVTVLDRDELMELYAIRSAVEELATRHGVPKLTDADLVEMDRLLRVLEVLDGSWNAFLDTDIQFHRMIYRAAGRQRWMDTIDGLWGRSRRYMLSSASASGVVDSLHADHRAIFAACQQRDAERAAAAIRAHLKQSEERLLEQWI